MSDILQRISSVHFFFSLSLTIFFLKTFAILPPTFDVALFACISAPATYAISYYTRHPRYVASKKPLWTWWNEFEALLMSYVMGYVTYVTLTESPAISVYTVAFTLAQLIRLLLALEVTMLDRLGIDTDHPITVLTTSSVTALLTTMAISITFL